MDLTGDFIPSAVSTDMYIGRASSLNSADNFKGSIDDIRIYNRTLSLDEIEALYHERGWEGSPLPVQLSSFTATDLGRDSVLLVWTTVSEVNCYGFFLQKSSDGQIWESVGDLIQGHGTTVDRHQYSVVLPSPPGGCWVRLMQVDLDGTKCSSDPLRLEAASFVLSDVRPWTYELAQNYPNPFNPSTTIKYGLPRRSHVTLTILNALGQELARLVDGEQSAGWHELRFDGAFFASGIYFCRLHAGSFAQTRKLVLLR
jgi:hypothetical protein